MNPDEVPPVPKGYHLVSSFRYPTRLIYLVMFPSVLASVGLYELAARGLIGDGVFRDFGGPVVVVFIGIIFFSTEIVSGLIQRGMNRLLGYNISFYALFLTFLGGIFAADPGQFQTRRDALLVAVAPLSIFLLLSIPLLFGLPEMISGILAYFLIVNISGRARDLYFIWKLLRMPRGTLLYTESILELLVFESGPDKA